ncbi:hypothetical protein BKA14_004097 [Actinoplanes abujensis]|uniref:Uncharacterized protein n=1 Tax=Paractinoplanes abujensis TaxID=882441 RepID=A0A7W7CT93_9ACTN|nr:hypothetical protein [Actinoplanes abujensis]
MKSVRSPRVERGVSHSQGARVAVSLAPEKMCHPLWSCQLTKLNRGSANCLTAPNEKTKKPPVPGGVGGVEPACASYATGPHRACQET